MDEPEAQDVAVLITRLRQSAILPYAHGDLLREAATALEALALEIAYERQSRIEWAKEVEREIAAWSAKVKAAESALSTALVDAQLGKLVRAKMVSGNEVPVERCVIRADEIAAIDAARVPLTGQDGET